MIGRILCAGLFSAALCLIPQPSPATNLNNSATKQDTQQVQAQLTPKRDEASPQPAQPTEEVAVAEPSGVEPETPQAQAKVAVQTPPLPTPEDEAKAFIYHVESTTNPSAENYLGCYGLGQDCNGIVKKKCGADYTCQDAFFTDYMKRRYGTWQKAKAFWQARVPINGKDVGNWW